MSFRRRTLASHDEGDFRAPYKAMSARIWYVGMSPDAAGWHSHVVDTSSRRRCRQRVTFQCVDADSLDPKNVAATFRFQPPHPRYRCDWKCHVGVTAHAQIRTASKSFHGQFLVVLW